MGKFGRVIGAFAALCLCAAAWAAGDDVQLTQRNSTDTNNINRVLASPAAGANGLITYFGATKLPGYVTLDPNTLSITSGVISVAASTQTDWNATTGRAVLLNKPSFATVAFSGQLGDVIGAGTAAGLNVATSGNATAGQVVKGDDTRLTDTRSTTAAQITDATTVGRSVLVAANMATARAAIGAGTSSFSGAYNDLSGLPATFPPATHTHPVNQISDSTAVGQALVTASSAANARGTLGLGTASVLDVAPTGNASTVQVVKGDDTRLSNARPTTTAQITDSTAVGRSVLTATDAAGVRAAIGAGPALTLTTTGSTGPATYNATTGALNVPTYVGSSCTKAYSYPTRALNTCFQISATRDVRVSYAVDITATLTLTAGPRGSAYLRTYTDAACSAGQQTVISGSSGIPSLLSVAVGLQNLGTAALAGEIPAGAYVRIETVNDAGTPAFNSRQGQEVQLCS